MIDDYQLRITASDAPSANLQVYDGYVLVAEASNMRITGSVVMNAALRPNAAIPVPETFDPPVVFRLQLTR